MDATGMPADHPALAWHRLRNTVLRRRTERLIGAAGAVDEDAELRFTVTLQPAPASGIAVLIDDRCDLADVHDLCHRVAAACLDDDSRVTFRRTTSGSEAVP